MKEQNISQEFRLNTINEAINYLIEEINCAKGLYNSKFY